MSTIFAKATGAGRAAVAIVRLSGPRSLEILKSLTKSDTTPIVPKVCKVSKLTCPLTNKRIDNALTIFFRGPHSFTGEDCVEFHVHGGPMILRRLYTVLGRFEQCLPASPGEFTQRAFINGKMDLLSAESINDAIHASSDLQYDACLGQLVDGRQTMYFEAMRSSIVSCLAPIEAFLEFSEDSDLGDAVISSVVTRTTDLRRQIEQALSRCKISSKLREGIQVALIGVPNAGKSSLFNSLVGRDSAIVSDIPGTTRDVINQQFNMFGFPVTFQDTGGLRSTSQADSVETEGMRRAIATANNCDLLVHVIDADFFSIATSQEDFDSRLLERFASLNLNRPPDTKVVHFINKIDLLSEEKLTNLQYFAQNSTHPVFSASCLTKSGLDSFVSSLEAVFSDIIPNDNCQSSTDDDSGFLANTRHQILLEATSGYLDKAQSILSDPHHTPDQIVIAAEYLRLASRSLGEIVGKIYTVDILRAIFSSFCIGK